MRIMDQTPQHKNQQWRLWGKRLEFGLAVIWPIIYLTFVVTEHYGVWDKVRGLDAAKEVAAQMDTSYDAAAHHQFRPGDKGYAETLSLIQSYTHAALPKDKKPVMIIRYQAILSGEAVLNNGKVVDWTAPSTPLFVLYHELPADTSDALQVGTIDDLHVWIERSKNDFRFFVQDVFLGIFSLALGTLLWLAHCRTE